MRSSRVLDLAVHALFGLTAASPVPDSVVFRPEPSPGSKGGVASESLECSQIGRDLLARGGNAVDAVVGTTFCVGVIAMYHSGIGGGGFMMVRDAEGNYEAIDFRESAPAAAFEDMYLGNVEGSIYGGLAAAVPGEVAGLEYAHRKYGALPWKTTMAGAIHLARHGFKVSPDLIKYSHLATKRDNFLVDDPAWAEDFAPNGTLLEVGDIMTRRRYADTLEKIAEQGAEAFYTGEIAESMIKAIQDTNGTMTLEDLRNYTVISRNVARITYRGADLHSIGSPANGAVTLNILKIMEQYPLADAADVNLTTHRFDEAMRFAYGARLALGDPDFVSRMDEVEGEMLSEEKAREIRGRIRDDRTLPVDEYDPERLYSAEGHGTSHISTADKSGMATSLTTTINLLYGAQLMDPDSGVIINNEMNDFSIPGVPNEFGFAPSEANFIRPHKRPLSSTTPIIASRNTTTTTTTTSPSSSPHGNSTLLATVGAAGGSRIVSATAQVLWRALEHDLSLTEALARPRLHDQLIPNYVLLEDAFDPSTAAGLAERGHSIRWTPPRVSAVQGVWRHEDGVFEAAGEPRQENSAGLTL